MLAFIIMFNRLTWPAKMAEYLSDTGCEVVLVDNGSTYPPLLEWYETCPYRVFMLNGNFGHEVIWNCAIIENNYPNITQYIVTDHDLDLSAVPTDYLDLLRRELAITENVGKAGFSLEIDDLPDNGFTKLIVNHELQFWNKKSGHNGFYDADIDTTFALYDRSKPHKSFWSAIRSPRPYTARHLPWYTTRESFDKNQEEQFYYNNSNTNMLSVDSSHWTNEFKKMIS